MSAALQLPLFVLDERYIAWMFIWCDHCGSERLCQAYPSLISDPEYYDPEDPDREGAELVMGRIWLCDGCRPAYDAVARAPDGEILFLTDLPWRDRG
jgi:hypothetical protein